MQIPPPQTRSPSSSPTALQTLLLNSPPGPLCERVTQDSLPSCFHATRVQPLAKCRLSCARRPWRPTPRLLWRVRVCDGCLTLVHAPLEPSDLGCRWGRGLGGRGALWPRGPSCCQTSSCAVCELEALPPRSPWVHSSCNSRGLFSCSPQWETRTRALNAHFGSSRAWCAARCLGCPIPSSPSLFSS